MAQTDWTFLAGGLDRETVARGVTSGAARPPGGGDFVYAFRSLVATPGAVALAAAQVGFTPLPKGGSIRACLQRAPSAAPTGFAPFVFLSAQSDSVRAEAYLLGLSDEEPHRLVLRKGRIEEGLAGADAPGALLKSSRSYRQGTWVHVRLDVLVEESGDVSLLVFENDLTRRTLGSPPDWQPAAGMSALVDDHLAMNTGSRPLLGGFAGFGFRASDVARRALVDHVELFRQE
jgi:hypothetical protein